MHMKKKNKNEKQFNKVERLLKLVKEKLEDLMYFIVDFIDDYVGFFFILIIGAYALSIWWLHHVYIIGVHGFWSTALTVICGLIVLVETVWFVSLLNFDD